MANTSITDPTTQPGRLFEHMSRNPHSWYYPLEIAQIIDSTAPHTIISQLRSQLPEDMELASVQETKCNPYGRTVTVTRYQLRKREGAAA